MSSTSPEAVYNGSLGKSLKSFGRMAASAMMGSTGKIAVAG